MPLFRYFGLVGGVLVAFLFAANWIWPTEPKAPALATTTESPVEQIIRIKSARRWPEKIVFDTNQPTIVAPAPAVEASAPPPPAPLVAANAPLEARAELKPAAPPPKRQAKARRHNSRPGPWHEPSHDPWHDPWRHPNAFASAGPMTPSWTFGRW